MNKKYTTLLLDVDNTLLDFSLAEEVCIKRVFTEMGLPDDDKSIKLYQQINDEFWKALERGEVTNEEVYTGRFEKFLDIIGKTADTALINEKYFFYLSRCAFKKEGCDEILDYLKGKYEIHIITNGAARNQHSRIKISGIGEKISGLFISEEIGFKKPQKEFFDAVFEKISEKDKTKILIVGDSLTSDILGGINAGVDTCYINWHSKEQSINSTYTLRNLYDLKNIL